MAVRRKQRQIKFYVEEETFQELQRLKVQNNFSTQALMESLVSDQLGLLRALRRPKLPLRIRGRFENEDGSQPAVQTLSVQEWDYTQLWLEALRVLPTSTSSALLQLIRDTLMYFQRSRLKAKQVVLEAEET